MLCCGIDRYEIGVFLNSEMSNVLDVWVESCKNVEEVVIFCLGYVVYWGDKEEN